MAEKRGIFFLEPSHAAQQGSCVRRSVNLRQPQTLPVELLVSRKNYFRVLMHISGGCQLLRIPEFLHSAAEDTAAAKDSLRRFQPAFHRCLLVAGPPFLKRCQVGLIIGVIGGVLQFGQQRFDADPQL